MPLLRKNGKDLLFIHIPKCGGTSLEQVFRPDVQLTLFHSGPGELHCSPQHFQAGLLEKLFDYSLPPTVVVVRNPFDRIVSEYRYQAQNGLDPKIGFDKFVANSLGEFWKSKYVLDNHIRPQVEFICTESLIFRFEEDGVQAACKYIANFFALTYETEMPVKNASEKIDFSIAPETLRLINKFYARDFELLGYPELTEENDEQTHSSLNYSSNATTPLTPSSIIRQKVSNDVTVVSQDFKSQMAAKLEGLESDRNHASESRSILEERLNQQSVANTEMTKLLDSIRTEVGSTDKHLADEIGRLYNSIGASDSILGGIKEGVGHIISLMALGFQNQQGEQAVRNELLSISISNLTEKLLGLNKSQEALGISIESKKAQLSESVDALRNSFSVGINESTVRVENKLSEIEQELARFKEEQESSRQDGQREVVAQFKTLVEIQHREICELDEQLETASSRLMESKSKVLYLESKLEDALALEAKNADQIGALTAQTLVLENEKNTLEITKSVLGHTIEGMERDFSVKTSSWEREKKLLEQGSSSLQRTIEEMQNALDARTSAWKEERVALVQESSSLQRSLEETQSTLDASVSTWEQERESLVHELSSRQRTIEETQTTLDAGVSAWGRERDNLLQESSFLGRALSEVQHTLVVNASTWRQEKEALVQESTSRALMIEEMEQYEQESRIELLRIIDEMQNSEHELRKQLSETLDRFHSEIDYRDTIKTRIRDLEADILQVRQHNKALLESTSFKVTKPLRVLSGALRIRRSGNKASSAILRLQDLRENTKIIPSTATAIDDGILTKNSQLRIAIIVENLDRGGLEQVVLDHARFFSSHCKSLDLYVINETGPVYEQALRYGINVFCVRNQKTELEEYLTRKRYDFAFFHHSYGFLPIFRPFTEMLVEVVHNEYSWQQDIEFFETIRKQTVDTFIAVSDPVREYSISKLAIRPENIVTIVNGLNIEGLIRPPIETLVAHRKRTLEESPTFVMCANGQPQKNHVLVIRAFTQLLKKYPHAKLQLAGNLAVDKSVELAIAAEMKRSGDPANIELLGSLNRRELSKLLSNAHIALLPTKYEGFSIATLEYLYFGLPMILSDTGGASYIANNYDTVIVDRKIARSAGAPTASEVRSLAGNMKTMIEQYATFDKRSERAARSYSNYTVDAACMEYMNLGDHNGMFRL